MVQKRYQSYQKEIPPSRSNIRYVKDTGRAQEKIELPLKMLVLGDFTLQDDDTLLEERERIQVNKNTFDSVMKEQGLKLSMLVPNQLSGEEDDQLKVELDVDSLGAFTPDSIVENVPELQKMIEVRQLLTDLKARVITNRKFRLALEGLLAKEDKAGDLAAIRAELDRIAPLPDIVKEGETESEAS